MDFEGLVSLRDSIWRAREQTGKMPDPEKNSTYSLEEYVDAIKNQTYTITLTKPEIDYVSGFLTGVVDGKLKRAAEDADIREG